MGFCCTQRCLNTPHAWQVGAWLLEGAPGLAGLLQVGGWMPTLCWTVFCPNCGIQLWQLWHKPTCLVLLLACCLQMGWITLQQVGSGRDGDPREQQAWRGVARCASPPFRQLLSLPM